MSRRAAGSCLAKTFMVTITAPVMKITRTLAHAMTAGFGEASLDKFGVRDCVQLTRYAPAALWNPDQYFALRIHRRCPRSVPRRTSRATSDLTRPAISAGFHVVVRGGPACGLSCPSRHAMTSRRSPGVTSITSSIDTVIRRRPQPCTTRNRPGAAESGSVSTRSTTPTRGHSCRRRGNRDS
jgi:hypothetical protein